MLIETRGEGGYVVAAPSPGYQFIHGKPNACPLITTIERDTLLDIARSFNQYYESLFPIQSITTLNLLILYLSLMIMIRG